jgi:hypothetical protein
MMDLSDTSREAQAKHAELLLKMEAQRRARCVLACVAAPPADHDCAQAGSRRW